MITSLIVLDLLAYSISVYKTHLIVLGIPFLKSLYPLIIYFLILSIFDMRYLFNLVVLFALYEFDKHLNKKLRPTMTIYIFKVIFYYLTYVSLVTAFSRVFR